MSIGHLVVRRKLSARLRSGATSMMLRSGRAAIRLLLGALTIALAVMGMPAAAATLGNSVAGVTSDSGDSNYLNGSKFTMPSTGGTVASLSVFVGSVGASPGNQYQLAIYTDSGGQPSALLAVSATGTLIANSWNTLPVAARLQANTPYWLMYNTNGTSVSVNNMTYGGAGTDAYSQNAVPFGTWPASFGAAVVGSLQFSIYASYSPDSGDTTPPSAPGNLSASGGAGSASLTWGAATDNVGVTGYAVYRSTVSGFVPGPANRIAQTSGLSYTDKPLAAGLYFYAVTASDAAGNVGAPSNQASVTVTAGSDPRATVGEWASPVAIPSVMQHAVLLPGSSRVLFFESGATAQVLDPVTGSVFADPVASNVYCSGHAFLADGRPVVIGGDTEAQGAVGLVDTNAFDPLTNAWARLGDMNYKRWYPTATRLSDGRLLALSGSSNGCNSCFVQTPEVFNLTTNSWTLLPAAAANIPYYPFAYVIPDGRIVQVGSSEQATTTRVLDVASQTWSTIDARVIDAGSSTMYRPGMVLKAGTASDGNTPVRPSSASAFVIDMTAPAPAWQPTGSMANPRAFLNLTTLPNGSVLATGGESTADGINLANAVYAAEVWSPATGTWSTLASASIPRLYHSVALLLPDGRVLVGGSGNDGAVPVELNYEIFSPPYLFQGTRPVISLAPGTVGFAQGFTVTTPDAARIGSVVLLAPAAVTHAFDQNARYVPLSFSVGSGVLQVQAPANGNVAPPGPYMMFIVDSSGIPSVASWLQVTAGTPDSTPPTAPGTLGASGSMGTVSLTWGPATDNVGVTSYNVYRSVTSGFAVGPANRIGQSSSTTFNDTGLAAGTYFYRVTASDAAGNIGPPSNEASAIVTQSQSSIGLEKTVFADASGTASITGLSTAAANDLLLAFVSADGPSNQSQTAVVSGAGLTWTLVRRTNTQSGSAEVWQALAPTPLANASVQSVLSRSGYHQSLTLVVLSGASGIGASAGASAGAGAPTAQITTTRAGSWIFGVGNDYDSAIARTLGPGQTMVHQWVETTLGDTYWVQRATSPAGAVGSVVTVNDTAPTVDRWNLTAVEVLAR
jgi:hypothetical protein